MIVKITAIRQVTFPAKVLNALGVKPGDQLEIQEEAGGFVLRPRKIRCHHLAPPRNKLKQRLGSFDIEQFRGEPYDPKLRD